MKFGDRTICAKAFSGSIGNAEALAIKSMYTSMADESCSITPGGLVRDGDASISSAKHEICNEVWLIMLTMPVSCISIEMSRTTCGHYTRKSQAGLSTSARTRPILLLILRAIHRHGTLPRNTKSIRNTLSMLCGAE